MISYLKRININHIVKYHDFKIAEFLQKLAEAGLHEFISKLENIQDSTPKNIDIEMEFYKELRKRYSQNANIVMDHIALNNSI